MKARYALIAFVPWIFLLLAYRAENRWLSRARNAGLLLLLVPFLGLSAKGQVPQPKTDHVARATCIVAHNREFTVFSVRYHVTYTDASPDFDAAIEEGPDMEALFDQCHAFMSATLEANIDEQIRIKKSDMAQARKDHYFLDAKKLAKK